MPPKKKPLPLHVSLARIQLERVNVAKRTEMRIAQLHKVEEKIAQSHKAEDGELQLQSHRCLNAFCFCVLLLVLNLLFLQWVYLKNRGHAQQT
jgi:hypothetical protein